jgi:hypothetical protein
VTPAQASPGEPLHFVGALPTAVRRPIVVQRGMYGNWIDLGTRHTNAHGAFSFSVPKNGMPSDPYRILAPQVRIGGHVYPALATPVRTIQTIEPDVEVYLSPTQDGAIVLTADATPARAGRTLRLERRVTPTKWVTVATHAEDRNGSASFAVTPKASDTVYRVVAATWNGAGWYPSFPVTVVGAS